MKSPMLSLHTLSRLIDAARQSDEPVTIPGTELANEPGLTLERRGDKVFIISSKFSLDEYLQHFNDNCYSAFAEDCTELLLEKFMQFELRDYPLQVTSKQNGSEAIAVFHALENLVAVIGDGEDKTLTIETFVQDYVYALPEQCEPITQDESYTVERFWQDIETLNWASDRNYYRIEKALLNRLSLSEVERFEHYANSMAKEVGKVIVVYEDKHNTQLMGDNGFDYTRYHVVGLGKSAFDAFLAFDGDLEAHIESLNPSESFAYAIPNVQSYVYPFYTPLSIRNPQLYFKAQALMNAALLLDIDLEEMGKSERNKTQNKIEASLVCLNAIVSGDHEIIQSQNKGSYGQFCFSNLFVSKKEPSQRFSLNAAIGNLIMDCKRHLEFEHQTG